jgi:ubiquinone/menaquinone biosynthesis C-methylase UbiE
LSSWGITGADRVTGIDLEPSRVATAQTRFPNRTYLQGSGEHLPFGDESFDRVISAFALPYMNIPKALTEIHRVLVSDGSLSLSLHLPSFTIHELVHQAIPKPVPTLYRLYVMANGLWFHCTGQTVGLAQGRTESFQTERGTRIALHRAGFGDCSFRRVAGPIGETFIVDAKKSKGVREAEAARAA